MCVDSCDKTMDDSYVYRAYKSKKFMKFYCLPTEFPENDQVTNKEMKLNEAFNSTTQEVS